MQTVVLVEDEPLVHMLGVDVLEEVGFWIIEAASAAVALRVLEVDPRAISVLVTNGPMPGSRDGEDLARIIAERLPRISIALTSGEVRLLTNDVPNHRRFVAKPWITEAIVLAIQGFVTRC